MLYTNVVPLLQELHRRTTTGSSLPVTKTFTINMEEEASLACPGVHRFADTGVAAALFHGWRVAGKMWQVVSFIRQIF